MNTTPLYIFDLDGTLADLKHRRHFVERPTFNLFDPKERKQANKPWKPNWDAFHAACVDDTPIKPVCDLLADLPPYCDVWVWSGRMETVRAQTIAWIQENTDIHTPDDILKMRPAGDFTPDDQLKESWLKAMSPEDRARLVMVFDDRDRVVNMWRRNGVVCAQVAPGDF